MRWSNEFNPKIVGDIYIYIEQIKLKYIDSWDVKMLKLKSIDAIYKYIDVI